MTVDDGTNPKTNSEEETPSRLAKAVGQYFSRIRFGIPLLILLSIVLIIVAFYVSWWIALPAIINFADDMPLSWIFAWVGLLFAAFGPLYALIPVGIVLDAAIQEVGAKDEQRALDALDQVEQKIRGSSDPVDYAQYGRKALNAYYLMGQNQVRLSFYIGVAAMIFGFAFLLAGLIVQTLDVTNISYLRKDLDVSLLTVAGGLIIEFIAATFLWIYRATIVQLNIYYRNQILIHNALISAAVSTNLGEQREGALRKIIEAMLTPWEVTPPKLPKLHALRAPQSSASSDASKEV